MHRCFDGCQGLRLHAGVLDAEQQRTLLATIESMAEDGRAGRLPPHAFTAVTAPAFQARRQSRECLLQLQLHRLLRFVDTALQSPILQAPLVEPCTRVYSDGHLLQVLRHVSMQPW